MATAPHFVDVSRGFKPAWTRLIAAGLLAAAGTVGAQLIVVEPDQYPHWSVMNHVVPEVSLITAGRDNLPHPPAPFDVWAATSTFPFAPPTGSNVFSHVGVPFWNTDRRLRMDFAGLVATVSIDFQGGTADALERGLLEAYSADNVLLDSYATAFLPGGAIETMSLTRPSPDIAYAIAYSSAEGFPFGRLDRLVFSPPVPEPAALWLAGVGLAIGGAAAGRRLGQRPAP